MTLKDAFQLPPLSALGVKSTPCRTRFSHKSTDGHLKPTEDNLNIDKRFSRADRGPLYVDRKSALLSGQNMDLLGQH